MSRLRSGKRLPQFVDEFDRNGREIVDEIERVLDLVRDAGGQLTERGQLLGLDQAILRGPQVLQRFRQFAGAGFHVFKQTRVLDRQHRLRREGLQQFDCALGKFARLLAPDHKRADDPLGCRAAERYSRARKPARTITSIVADGSV